MINKIAVIVVDANDEVSAFYKWLASNRGRVVGISANKGCGCCVDCFDIVIEDGTEEMPCNPDGTFESDSILYGEEMELVLTDLLE